MTILGVLSHLPLMCWRPPTNGMGKVGPSAKAAAHGKVFLRRLGTQTSMTGNGM